MTRKTIRAGADLRRVFDDLVRFETVLWGAVDERLQQECGITLSHLNVMLIIEATPLCRVLDIAQALEITVGGTSQAVDRIEKAGRCLRRANPTDRRSSIVELTPDGQELVALAGPVFDRELENFLRTPLTGEGFESLATALGVLRRSTSLTASAPTTPK